MVYNRIYLFPFVLTGMVAGPLNNKFGGRVTLIIGGLLSASGYMLSAFATSVEYLIATMGILAGRGFLLFDT